MILAFIKYHGGNICMNMDFMVLLPLILNSISQVGDQRHYADYTSIWYLIIVFFSKFGIYPIFSMLQQRLSTLVQYLHSCRPYLPI